MSRLAKLLEIPFMLVGYFFTWFGPFLHELGGMVLFGGKVILHIPRRPFEWGELIVQLYYVGVKSLPIVALAGFFIGAVVAVQFNYAMGLFGATQYLGGMTTSALLREVGPAVIAVMIAGRIGAFVTAELGTMKATEQLDAVRCLGANAIQFLVVPRFIAVALMIALLNMLGLVIGAIGGAIAAWLVAGMGLSYYFASIRSLAAAWALFNGASKGIVFGIMIATISCYKGMTSEGGTEGVGKAVNQSLVICSIAVFFSDYVMAGIASITFQVAEKLLFFEGLQ